MYRVFLSSTSVDLEPYRKAVLQAISKVDGFMPVAMENFGARDASAVDFDDRKVRQSDLFIGLLGHCYGSSPRGTAPSFTEREYDSAVDAGIPRLMFVAPEQFLVPAHLIEADEQRQRQNVFRTRVDTDRVRDASFESPAELARAATAALANWQCETGIDVAPEILPTVDTRGFVGRGWYLFQLKQLLIGKERGAIAGLHGGPGFGKSALAAFFADRYRNAYPDGIVTVDRRQHPNAEAIAQHFAALISDPVDQDREGALRASEIMQTRFSRRRCLLILDNADEKGITGLTITGRSALLITTRDREHLLSLGLSADACIGLKPLKPFEEGAMLANLIGRDRARAERGKVQLLFRIVRGLPLALRIAAQTIATIQGSTPVNDYLRQLTEERASLLDRFSEKDDAELNLRSMFQLSLKLMIVAQQATFACLSTCAPSGFDRRSAAQAAGYDNEDMANRDLSRLTNLGLLEHVRVTDRFKFHPLLLAFGKEEATRLGVREAAEARYSEHIGRFVAARSRPSAENIRDLLGEQDAIFQVAEYRARTGHFDFPFLNGLNVLIDQTGQWARGMELAELALAQPEWLDERVSAVLHMQRGKHRDRLGLSEQALEDFDRSLELNTRLGDERSQAMALNSRGGVRRDCGDLDGALADLDRAVKIGEKLGDERSQAMALNSRGGVRRDRGDLEGALADLDRAVKIGEKLGDKRQQAMVLNSRYTVKRDWGDFEGALQDLTQIRDMQKLTYLGYSGKRLKEYSKDLRDVLTKISSAPNRRQEFEIDFLKRVAINLIKTKDFVSSIHMLYRVMMIARSEEVQRGCLFSLGKAYFGLKQYENAVGYFKRARDLGYDTSELWADLGRALSEEAAPLAEVRDAFNRAIKDEANAWAFSWYGLALSREGLHEEAQTLARQAVDKKPENSALLNNLALVLMAMGDDHKLSEAIVILEEAVELAPPDLDWPKKNLEAALRMRTDLASQSY